ncbi:hypothetical protein E2562_016427 [Oryza meyeriana var. granulata]|uniref:Uncharacterized protein n=1 Tax=Oryza meyeriana var. granulata TaxID=110450 RepID=A0A6G1EX83_9ORYZ|nr:hypothetical protein E2562_016427 [Oryza meyeriana var. granulata]
MEDKRSDAGRLTTTTTELTKEESLRRLFCRASATRWPLPLRSIRSLLSGGEAVDASDGDLAKAKDLVKAAGDWNENVTLAYVSDG